MAFFFLLFLILSANSSASSTGCRSSCGALPIRFPLGVDDGCGSPVYRHLLSCINSPSSSSLLLLRTPSGSYPVKSISYSGDPHLVISDPSMWTCSSHSPPRPPSPFSLDASTRFSLSPKNTFLFLNCSPEAVLIEPRSPFCDRDPGRCGTSCDSAAYLCRNLPGCPNELAERATTCCSYFPTAAESVRMMLRHCAGYATVYWTVTGGGSTVEDEVPGHGIRVDFEIPTTARCQSCAEKGGGTCGFDTATGSFLCLCHGGNSTTNCEDGSWSHRASAGDVAVPATLASFTALVCMGTLLIYCVKKMKSKKVVVTCGVQTDENRIF